MTMLAEIVDVVIGVDTHKHTHSAAVLTASTAAVLEETTVPANRSGYASLVTLANGFSGCRAWAIEGTGSYGAGLTRYLQARGEKVIELDRPWRARRRNPAKNDTIDAVRAAREALGEEHHAQPRSGEGRAALAMLIAARRSAVKAAADAQHQLDALIVTAPQVLRDRFESCTSAQVLTRAAGLHLEPDFDLETRTAAEVLRRLARRCRDLRAEANDLRTAIGQLVRALRPELLDVFGVGPVVAGIVLCSWSHPGRFRSEAAFAKLAGAAPIPASSGLTTRHRLDPSGDRQLNFALHTVVITRLRTEERTRAYAERRRSEGKTDREIKRCLKRYVARELFRLLENAA